MHSISICVSLQGNHISLVICVSPVGKHISLVICVRGNTYHGKTYQCDVGFNNNVNSIVNC